MKNRLLIAPLLITGIYGLMACTPAVNNVPLNLEGTNISYEVQSLQQTQAAINYYATQTPYAATLAVIQTQESEAKVAQSTQEALSIELTQVALKVFTDGATATYQAQMTQDTIALEIKATADFRTQQALDTQATETKTVANATATETALVLERKEKINGLIAYTPFIFVAGILFMLWRFVLVTENRKSVFNTPSGEMIFTRRIGVALAIIRVLLRRLLPEITFDDFTMPGRAVGHGVRETREGYKANGDEKDRAAQLAVIGREQLKIYTPALPSGPLPGDYPALPAYTELLGPAGAVETVAPNAPEIGTWIMDVEEQQ